MKIREKIINWLKKVNMITNFIKKKKISKLILCQNIEVNIKIWCRNREFIKNKKKEKTKFRKESPKLKIKLSSNIDP